MFLSQFIGLLLAVFLRLALVHSDSRLELENALADTWNTSTSGVSIFASSPGKFTPTDTCSTPKLWLFLYGHYRALWRTQHYFKAVLDAAAPGCYMVQNIFFFQN